MSYLSTARKAKAKIATERPEPADDPILTLDQWYPEFHRLRRAVAIEAPGFDYGRIRARQPDLYAEIKALEHQIDELEAARLSAVMAIMADWRTAILKGQEILRTDAPPLPGTAAARIEKEGYIYQGPKRDR